MSEPRVEVLRRLARRNAEAPLQKALEKSRAVDIASAIRHLAPAEQRRLMSHVRNDDVAAEVLARVDAQELENLVRELDFDRLVDLLDRMDVDDEADVIDRLPEDLRGRVLEAIQTQDKELVEEILAWPEDSAGGIMQPLAFQLNENLTCRDAIAALHEQHDELETVFYLYVMNDGGQLVGVTSLRGLLTHPPSTPLKEIMSTDIISVRPEEDQEDVARLVSRYDLLAVPVVDNERKLLGIVTVDDVLDVIKEEALEDMMLMAGVDEEVETSDQSLFRAARTRVRWLLITLGTGMAISEIIAGFSEPLSRNLVLAGFMPVVMGMGGNVGTQAATITVRNLAIGRVTTEQGTLKLIWRESRVGLLMGVFFGVLLFGYVMLRHQAWAVSGAIAGSIAISLVNAAVMGTLVPLTLHRAGVDPAVATGPFVTTAIDLVTVLVYFLVSTWLFGL